jgi:hypothetical protein
MTLFWNKTRLNPKFRQQKLPHQVLPPIVLLGPIHPLGHIQCQPPPQPAACHRCHNSPPPPGHHFLHCRCCPSPPQLLPIRLCQSLPPQPYALEVSNRVREGQVIASRQPQLGGGGGQRRMMTTMMTSTAAVDNHGGATPSPPTVPDRRRVRVSLPPGTVGGIRPSRDDQCAGPPAESRRRHRHRHRHRRRCRRRRTNAMGTTT